MFHAMSLAEIDEQHVELLPTRTLMSLMTQGSKSTPGQPGESVTEGPSDDSSFVGFLGSLGKALGFGKE
jgi:hypothetical protein